MLISGIVELPGAGHTCIFLSGHCRALHGGSLSLYSHQRYPRVLVSSHPHGHWMLPIFSISAILVGADWYLIVVLIEALFKKKFAVG